MASALLCSLLLIPFQDAEAVALKWQFKDGDTFQQQTRSQLSQTVKIGEQEFKQDIVHTTVIRFTVQQVEADGTVTLEQKIESIKATNPDGTSAAGSNAVLNQMQGMTFTCKLGKDLQVQSVEGYEELLRSLAGDDPGIRRVVQALLSENQLKSVLQQSFGFVPPSPVKPGATWNRDLPLSLGPLGNVTLKQEFRLEGIEQKDGRSLAQVVFVPNVSFTPPKPEAANPEMSVTGGAIQSEGSRGTLYFDLTAGRLDRSETKLVLRGNLAVKLNGKDTPLTFEQTQTIEVRITK